MKKAEAISILATSVRPREAKDRARYDKAVKMAIEALEQPERTCVNCGRTGCPIEEHYALPKDGYCHLWEKRNVTDDDYPERREE